MAEFRYVYSADAYDDSVAFYRDVLGAEQVDGWERGPRQPWGHLCGRRRLHRGDRSAALEWLGELGQPRDTLRGRAGAGWLLIEVDDVDAFHERLREQGADIIESPRDLSWGHRDFGVREPGGMTLYFFSRV